MSGSGAYFLLRCARMFHVSSNGITNYQHRDCSMRTATGGHFPIVGTGNRFVNVRSAGEVAPLRVLNVTHVPYPSHHLFSLPLVADAGSSHVENEKYITISLAKSTSLLDPSVGELNYLHARLLHTVHEDSTTPRLPWGLCPSTRCSTSTITAAPTATRMSALAQDDRQR